MRNRAGLVLPGAVCLVVGAVLLVVPVVLVLTGSVLGLVWTVLLWVGFAETVIGSALLALAAAARPTVGSVAHAPYDAGEAQHVDEPVVTPSE